MLWAPLRISCIRVRKPGNGRRVQARITDYAKYRKGAGTVERSLRIGEMVMMPFWGLGEVMGVSQKAVLGSERAFFHLRPLRLHHPIRIPEEDLADMGVRPVLSGRQMSEIIFCREFPPRTARIGQTGGYDHWIKLLRSGLPGVRPWILRQMQRLNRPLGPRESELRQIIRQNFREEIRVVFGCSRCQAAAYARQALA